MGFLDFIKNLFNNGKTNTKLITVDLTKTFGGTEQLEVSLTDKNNNPLPDKEIIIEINDVKYSRVTDKDGIARLNINLGVGNYKALFTYNGDDEYNKSTAHCMVYVNPVISVKDLSMTYRDGSRFEARLTDKNGKVLSNVLVVFKVNGVSYERISDDNGVAGLNINLNPGEYPIVTKAGNVEITKKIQIHKAPTRMEGTDITKTASEKAVYQCAVYDSNNNRVKCSVDITVNGVTYNRSIDDEGLAKLNINLGKGEYNLKAEFKGDNIYLPSSISNRIVVNDDPKPEPKPEPKGCENPYTSSPHPTSSGCNGMGQNNAYCCGPSAIHKSIYKFGIRDITQGQISSWAGTTSSGTGHDGLNTAIAQINRVKGTNITIDWYNLSDLGWEQIGKIICQPNKAVITHILYKNGGTCDGSGNFGHYESLVKVNTATGYVKVINSLGGSCGGCYCGYYQDRTIACEERFISGISQKSIAVLTMN